MRVTVAVDYAVRALVDLAGEQQGRPVTAEAIAERHGIPLADLLDVLADLKLRHLVDSRLGPDGGYWLRRPADRISVADVVRAVDGVLVDVGGAPPELLEYPGEAGALRDVWLATRASVRRVLEQVSVQDVALGCLPDEVAGELAAADAQVRRPPGQDPLDEGVVLDGGARVAHLPGVELPPEDVVVAPEPRLSLPARGLCLVAGIWLFVTALGLMKAGATELLPALEGSVFTDNALSTLGFGWLGACIVLSGSPVAAASLTLLDGGAIDRTQSFTMLAGSRLGAAFVVLVVGVTYALRRPEGTGRRAPISIGILSLLMTAVVYVPGAVAGYVLLERGAFDGLDIGTSPRLTSLTDTLFGWTVDATSAVVPGWALFPVGLVVLLVGFSLFDRVMPSIGSESLEHRPGVWYTRKWPMFFLGCGVCLLTLSVSVALTVLVPLVAKGYIRRANVLPYIAGANITTLADTLVAAILLGNQDGVRVVVAVTLSVTVWTVALLALFYPLLRRLCLGVARRALRSPARLAAFVALLFAMPLTLIAV
ncbi:MAG: Rrf2 family transcriptional regulator [Actinomycetota bacterium]|nr:Rrf2 family transcriptional regulator [Actinomycetota bacterium]